MAGKAKSTYVTVSTKGDPFDVKARKQFFNAKAMREWKKTAIETWPEVTESGAQTYRYTVEIY